MFVAGVPARTLGILCLLGLILLPIGWLGMDDYQKERIRVFLNPERDPLGAGWNKIQSEIAVGSGGFWGKGYMKGTQNILGFLPRVVAPTDFIYSVIAEESGFVGSLAVLVLFGIVVVSGLRTALLTRDKLGRLLATGVVTILFAHVFVNIAMTVGLMPITGFAAAAAELWRIVHDQYHGRAGYSAKRAYTASPPRLAYGRRRKEGHAHVQFLA